MATSYRDRTAEFRSVTETLKKIGGISAVDSTGNYPSTANFSPEKPPQSSTKSEFNKKASRIGLGIHEANRKIARLSQLAKRSSMFDDPTAEIQQLTTLIKDDITTLDVAVADLQTLQNTEIAKNYSDDTIVHANAICDDVKNRLMAATKQFQDVLTTRTQNIKAHETRKKIFSANSSREDPSRQQIKPSTEPPPWFNSSNAPSAQTASNGGQASSQLRRRLATDNIPSSGVEMQMLQQVAPQQEDYSRSHASALQNVESTITELGGIFTHLATMVAHQGELAIRDTSELPETPDDHDFKFKVAVSVVNKSFVRWSHEVRIDDNMDESLGNVEGAHNALLKHLTRISSNRSLLIKLFAILIFFLVIFIFFIV